MVGPNGAVVLDAVGAVVPDVVGAVVPDVVGAVVPDVVGAVVCVVVTGLLMIEVAEVVWTEVDVTAVVVISKPHADKAVSNRQVMMKKQMSLCIFMSLTLSSSTTGTAGSASALKQA